VLRSITFPRGVLTLHTDASGTAPPDAFGPFRVLHQIGAGVLGPVFRAYQPDPGRLVAVKQFRLDLPPENAHRFVAALDRLIAADLTHMGIAAPLAAGLTDNSPFLALDFVAAESFDVVIRDYGPAPVTEALRIATQLGGALDFAAAVNVFHGTLHPRDVLVSPDDTRVTGLGVAQALESIGVVPPIRRPYTAPERLAGGTWDRRADTFSLAALVYEMLFGRRIPGTGHDAAEAITPLEGADTTALRELFGRALAENPSDRFDTALAFAEALHGVVVERAPAKNGKTRRKRENDTPAAGRPSTRRRGLPLEDEELPLIAAEERPIEGAHDDEDTVVASDAPPPASADPVESMSGERLREAHVPPPSAASDPLHDVARGASSHTEIRPPAVEHPRGVDRISIRAADEQDVREKAPFDDLELKNAQDERYTFAESESALPDVAAPDTATALTRAEDKGTQPDLDTRLFERFQPADVASETAHSPSLSSVAIEQSRSAVWPIALALIVGLLVGFAGGYAFFVVRDRAAIADSSAGGAAPSAPAPTPSERPSVPPAAVERNSQPPVEAGRGTTAAPSAAAPPAPAPVSPRPAPAAVPPKPAAPDDSVRTTGRVNVESMPAGARVSIDGRDVGVTPLTIPALARGSHVVRITHQGYVAAERRVRIGSNQPAQSIEVDLVAARAAREAAPAPTAPERTSGSLIVDSRPIGARVFVDGKLVGTTPLLLEDVAAGDHGVRLELDGFNAWTTSTKVTGGERTRVSGSLEQP